MFLLPSYVTKEDLAEVVQLLTKEITKLRDEMPKKAENAKPKMNNL